MHARILADRHDLGRLQARVSDPRFVISDKQQHLDELAVRLERATLRGLSRRRLSLERLHPRLMARHPRAVLARAKGDLVPLDVRLQSAVKARVGAARGRLAQATIELDALSPLRVLGRGYAIATRKDGQALLRSTDVRVGESIDVRLHEGKLEATVSGTDEGS
jgi:exodeoxyribonuclease VII large subunit